MRITACLGLSLFVGFAGILGFESLRLFGPYMGLGNLLGLILLVPSLSAILVSLGFAVLVVHGYRWALYLACLPSLWVVSTVTTFGVSSPFPILFSGAAFVLGSAIADLPWWRLERPILWVIVRTLVPIGLVHLALVGWISRERAESQRSASARAIAQVKERREEQRQADLVAAKKTALREAARRKRPGWDQHSSPVIDVALNGLGTRAVTLHQDGSAVTWDSNEVGRTQRDVDRSLAQYGPVEGARQVFFGPADRVVVQAVGTLYYFGASGRTTIQSCSALASEQELLTELVAGGRIAAAGSALCFLSIDDSHKPVQVPLTGCGRIHGLHADTLGQRLLVQCRRRVMVLDVPTQKVRFSVTTPDLLPKSARFRGHSYVGLSKKERGYFAVLGAFAKPQDVTYVPLGTHHEPQLELLAHDAAFGPFVVIGDGICVYPQHGQRPVCPIEPGRRVRLLALPGELRKVRSNFYGLPRHAITPEVASFFTGLAQVEGTENPLQTVTLPLAGSSSQILAP